MEPTREQLRAQKAFEQVSSREKDKDYGRACLRLPALIQQCGLCQALAFLEAKKKDDLLRDLTEVAGLGSTEAVRKASLVEYQRLSLEALQCAQWLKRYAEAVIKVELGDDGGRS